MSEARRVEWFAREPGGGTVYVPSGRRWIGPEQAAVLMEQVRERYGVAEDEPVLSQERLP